MHDKEGEGKHKRRRQGFDMARGNPPCGVGPCGRVGSANSSELEARPSGAQRGRRNVSGAFGDGGARQKRHQSKERELHFGEGIHEDTKLLSVIGTWVKVQQRIVVERGVWRPLRQKNRQMRPGH